MATAKKKTKADMAKIQDVFSFDDIFTEADDDIKPVAFSKDVPRISTGYLVLDLFLDAGMEPGHWYEIQGPRSGGKTTVGKACLRDALKKIPNKTKVIYIDAEGSCKPKWLANILQKTIQETKDLFGRRDATTGEYVCHPQIRLIRPKTGEKALQYVSSILFKMPDKEPFGDTWYYVYTPAKSKDDEKNGIPKLKELQEKYKGLYSAKLLAATGNICIPVPNNYAGAELLIFVDCMTALNPQNTVHGQSDQRAQQAQMFARYLPDIKNDISRKGIIVIGINQHRNNVGGYGSADRIPGGNTLEHVVDTRIRLKSCGSQWMKKGESDIEGHDEFRWSSVKTTKNKLFAPLMKAFIRIWTKHKNVSGFGVDPYMDTLNYLEMTSQLLFEKNKFKLNIPGFRDTLYSYGTFRNAMELPRFKFTPLDQAKVKLKEGLEVCLQTDDGDVPAVFQGMAEDGNALVLIEGEKKPTPISIGELFIKSENVSSLAHLRDFCFEQMASGEALARFSSADYVDEDDEDDDAPESAEDADLVGEDED